MKKVMALILTLVMAFSIAVVPASAVDVDDVASEVSGVADDASSVVDSATGVYDALKAEDYETAIKGTFTLVENLINAIHNLVGSIMYMVGNECPFCDESHGSNADVDDSGCTCIGDCTCGTEQEEPRTEGAAFVVDATTQTTYGGEEYYGDIFIEAIATVSVIELLSITADVNNVVVLDAENTVVFSGGNFTLPEGGKLVVDNSDTITQVMFSTGDIIVNGEVLTEDNVAQYVEGVEWPWFY